jgi:hypothetical protein
MRIIHVDGRILSVITLATGVSLTSPSAAQPPFNISQRSSSVPPKEEAQPTATNETFQCNNPKTQQPGDPSSKHSVTLSWKASMSLSTPLADGEGYNVYRANPDDFVHENRWRPDA